MKVHLIGPEGERIGPFRSVMVAKKRASICLPDAVICCRDEDPNAWEIDVQLEKRDLRRYKKP